MVRLIKNIINDLLDQAWTLLGMFIAWVVLDGSAKTVVGYGIIMTTIIWIITSPIRHRGED
jgi:ABC-type multidrug transport system permease subunit